MEFNPEQLEKLKALLGPRHDADTPDGVTGAGAGEAQREARGYKERAGRGGIGGGTGPNPVGSGVREQIAGRLGPQGNKDLYAAISSVLGNHYTIGRNAEGRAAHRRIASALSNSPQGLSQPGGGGIRTAGGLQAPPGLVPSGPRGSSLSGAGQRSASLQGLNMPDMLGEMRRRKEAEEAARRQQAIIERGQNIRNERAATGLDQRTALFEMLKRFM